MNKYLESLIILAPCILFSNVALASGVAYGAVAAVLSIILGGVGLIVWLILWVEGKAWIKDKGYRLFYFLTLPIIESLHLLFWCYGEYTDSQVYIAIILSPIIYACIILSYVWGYAFISFLVTSYKHRRNE